MPCHHCGAELPERSKFCLACGAAVAPAPPAAPARQAPATERSRDRETLPARPAADWRPVLAAGAAVLVLGAALALFWPRGDRAGATAPVIAVAPAAPADPGEAPPLMVSPEPEPPAAPQLIVRPAPRPAEAPPLTAAPAPEPPPFPEAPVMISPPRTEVIRVPGNLFKRVAPPDQPPPAPPQPVASTPLKEPPPLPDPTTAPPPPPAGAPPSPRPAPPPVQVEDIRPYLEWLWEAETYRRWISANAIGLRLQLPAQDLQRMFSWLMEDDATGNPLADRGFLDWKLGQLEQVRMAAADLALQVEAVAPPNACQRLHYAFLRAVYLLPAQLEGIQQQQLATAQGQTGFASAQVFMARSLDADMQAALRAAERELEAVTRAHRLQKLFSIGGELIGR